MVAARIRAIRAGSDESADAGRSWAATGVQQLATTTIHAIRDRIPHRHMVQPLMICEDRESELSLTADCNSRVKSCTRIDGQEAARMAYFARLRIRLCAVGRSCADILERTTNYTGSDRSPFGRATKANHSLPDLMHKEQAMGNSTNNENTWAMLCHLSTFAGYLIPFGNIVGPLVVWLMKKNESALVDDQGKEALNFQISVTIYAFICGILIFVLIGLPLLIALVIFDLVVTIMACIKASAGEYYRYPLSIRMIR
jgi:uncharacterized Tic20 family protein